MAVKKKPLPGMSASWVGADYDRNEIDFLRALQAWRNDNHRHPTQTETLQLIESLGWERRDNAAERQVA